MDNQRLINTLKNIIFQFGVSVFFDTTKLPSLLADFVPELTLERKLIKEAISVNALKDIVDANYLSDEEKNNALLKAQQKLISLCGINNNLSAEILNCFAEALGWQASLAIIVTQQELETEKENLQFEDLQKQISDNRSIIENYFTRAYLFLEEQDWDSARQYFNQILDLEPKCAKAYLGLFLTENHISSEGKIDMTPKEFDINADPLLKRAISFSTQKEREEIVKRIKNAYKAFEATYGVLSELREKFKPVKGMLSVRYNHVVIALLDGTVVEYGDTYKVKNINDAVSIIQQPYFLAVLNNQGYVYSIGIIPGPINNNIQNPNIKWSNIIKIAAGGSHLIGLRNDGTCVAYGKNTYHECEVQNWTEIKDVECGDTFTVGIKTDGSFVTCGEIDNYFLGNSKGHPCELSQIDDVVSIACGNAHTAVLKKDGTVVCRGWNEFGQCNTESWTDIVEISCGNRTTFGIRKDGTVLSCGVNDAYQCNVQFWTDIIAIGAGNSITVGVKKDGSVIYTHSDGNSYIIDGLKLFLNIDSFEQDRMNAVLRKAQVEEENKMKRKYKYEGKCQYCGGDFKGVFNKVCTSCRRKKDY